MPAYAKDGHVICFFQSAHKFKARYATFGFSDTANLDEGTVWPLAFAVKELTAADEARIGARVAPRLNCASTASREIHRRWSRSYLPPGPRG
jgi:hypothetical protein